MVDGEMQADTAAVVPETIQDTYHLVCCKEAPTY